MRRFPLPSELKYSKARSLGTDSSQLRTSSSLPHRSLKQPRVPLSITARSQLVKAFSHLGTCNFIKRRYPEASYSKQLCPKVNLAEGTAPGSSTGMEGRSRAQQTEAEAQQKGHVLLCVSLDAEICCKHSDSFAISTPTLALGNKTTSYCTTDITLFFLSPWQSRAGGKKSYWWRIWRRR